MNRMWTAIYKDGTNLEQFEQDKEHLFREIEEEKLECFMLRLGNNVYAVNLIDGSFTVNKETIRFEGFQDEKFKLIHFRRVRKVIGDSGTSLTIHCLGWQIKGSQEKPNQQRIMKIQEDNSVSFGVK